MAGRFSIEAVFKGIDQMSGTVAKISSRFERMSRNVKAPVQQINKMTDRTVAGMAKLGLAATAAGAVATVGIEKIIEPSIAVENSLAKVATVITPVTGTIQDALAKTKKAAVDWSKQHVASAEEFLDANYRMASAGLNSTQAIAGTRAALTLATATMGDATTAGNLLATVYNNMGNKTADVDKEMGHLADVLAKTQAMFQLADLSQLNESMKLATPSAIQFGVGVEQLSTVVGALNSAGLQGSVAGSAFAASMRQMGKASRELGFGLVKTKSGGIDFIGTLGRMEKKFGSFAKMTDAQKAAFQKAFGDEGVRAIALMLGKTGELSGALDKVANSTGAAESAAKIIEGTRSNSWQILGNQLDAVKMSLADGLLPTFDKLKPIIDKVVGRVSAWADANKDLIASKLDGFLQSIMDNAPAIANTLERIGRAAGPLLAVAGAVKVASLAMAALDLVMAANPITLWIVGLTVAAALIAAFWPEIKAAASAAWKWVSDAASSAWAGIVGFVSDAWDKVKGVLGGIGEFFSGLWDSVVSIFQSVVVERIAPVVMAGVEMVKSAWSPITDFFSGLWDSIAGTFEAVIGGIVSTIENVINKVRGIGAMVLGGGEEAAPTGGAGRASGGPTIVTAGDSMRREISEMTTTDRAELTIRDATGRAEMTRPPKRGGRINLQPSGAF